MEMADLVALPAHRTVVLTERGLHIMIMQPTRTLRPGDRVRLTFVFARAEPLTVIAPVTAVNGGPPAGQGGHRHG
jgi:copper(I)-binding protein